MKYAFSKKLHFQKKYPSLLAFTGSICLSLLWTTYHQPFNSDGALFLYSAKIFLTQGLKQAVRIYPWPFYSICIAYFHKISGLQLIQSAYILQSIFKACLALIFVDILKEVESELYVQYAGAFLIVFFTTIMLLSRLIIRDFGFWLFVLLSFDLFIRFLKSKNILLMIGWSLSLIIAFLFREEGILYLTIFFALWGKEKFFSYKKLIFIILLIFINVFIIYFTIQKLHIGVHGIYSYTVEKFNTFNPFKAYKNYKNLFVHTFGFDTTSFAKYSLIGGIILNTIVSTISALGLPQTCFLLYGIKKNIFSSIEPKYKTSWGFYINLSIIIQIFFLFWHQFTVERYFTTIGIFLLFPVSYSLSDVFKTISNKSKKYKILVWSGVLYMVIGSIIYTGLDHSPIQKASQWININIPKNQFLYTNETVINYLTGRFHGWTPSWPGSGYTINVLTASDILKRMPKNSYGAVSVKNTFETNDFILNARKKNVKILKTFTSRFSKMTIFIFKILPSY